MEENKNSDEQLIERKPNQIIEIILGFVVGIIIGSIFFGLYVSFRSDFLAVLLPILYLVLVILCLISRPQRYLGIGLLIALLIPLLVFGGCVLILTSL